MKTTQFYLVFLKKGMDNKPQYVGMAKSKQVALSTGMQFLMIVNSAKSRHQPSTKQHAILNIKDVQEHGQTITIDFVDENKKDVGGIFIIEDRPIEDKASDVKETVFH